MFLLVPAYPGCPGQMAIKWLLLLLYFSDESLCKIRLWMCQIMPCEQVSIYAAWLSISGGGRMLWIVLNGSLCVED